MVMGVTGVAGLERVTGVTGLEGVKGVTAGGQTVRIWTGGLR